jgi:phosphopentomutase
MKRAFLIVFDSVGIGEAPDAAAYGDAGANTLGHLSAATGGLKTPALQRLGLGNIPGLLPMGIPIAGCPAEAAPLASFGAMRERSQGKDTTTGHWEMAGLFLKHGFALFPKGPPSFPPELLEPFERSTGRGVIGNKAASGLAIIDELGAQHMANGAWIVYTSGDSVFQIAAHEDVIPLPELYRGCEIARALCEPYRVGRVIARPFVGRPGAFKRTENRRDFSYPLPEPTLLDRLSAAGVHTITVGKLDDVFARRGIDESVHVENNADAQSAVLSLASTRAGPLFVFANLIDFDMLYGHRRDARGYALALERADAFVGELLGRLGPDDVMLITADHGNDPTFRGSDHTREFVPLLVYRPGQAGRSLGIRDGFYDIARSLSLYFGLTPMPRGAAFL